jgi:hypothetical protein
MYGINLVDDAITDHIREAAKGRLTFGLLELQFRPGIGDTKYLTHPYWMLSH